MIDYDRFQEKFNKLIDKGFTREEALELLGFADKGVDDLTMPIEELEHSNQPPVFDGTEGSYIDPETYQEVLQLDKLFKQTAGEGDAAKLIDILVFCIAEQKNRSDKLESILSALLAEHQEDTSTINNAFGDIRQNFSEIYESITNILNHLDPDYDDEETFH